MKSYLEAFMSTDLVSGLDERMWTEKEVAHLLHVGVKTMWIWRRDKLVTFVRLPNGRIRYRRQDLENLLGAGLCLSKEIKNTVPAQSGGE